jgi:ADP-heptose:LPS heptosyltransferase
VLHEPLLPRFFGLWRRLKREQFQEVVVFHASQRLVLPLCAVLGAKKIVGTAGINKGLDALLTDPIPPYEEHEIVRRLRLIEQLGATRRTEELSFFPAPPERTTKHSDKKIAIHPGSKDGFKRWPAEHFIRVGQKLAQLGAKITLTGSKEEKVLMEQIADKISGAACLDTHLSLRAFAQELASFDGLISNDTGPVHLACALKVPVIAIYSPTDPLLCGPHKAKKALALAGPPTCNPCLKRKCRRPFCLLQISPEEVIAHAMNID